MTTAIWIDPRTGPLPPPLEDVPILFRDPTEYDIAFDLGYLDRKGRWHLSGTPTLASLTGPFQPLAWLQVPPYPDWIATQPVGCGERSEPHHPRCPNCRGNSAIESTQDPQ